MPGVVLKHLGLVGGLGSRPRIILDRPPPLRASVPSLLVSLSLAGDFLRGRDDCFTNRDRWDPNALRI
jgi:hypothetical protein